MKHIHVFTSAACNYIPKVRVLVESIKKWHPEWRIHLALSDEIPADIDLSNEHFDEIHIASRLDIPDFVGWSFCHSIVELSTAIKPFMLKKLLERDDCAGVVYMDPDTVLFSRIDEVVTVLTQANIALTPHQLVPETALSAVIDNEICSLKHGIYNLGFIAVAPTDIGQAFAAWWADLNYYFCRTEIANGLFTVPRWIDLVPAFFDGVAVMRTSRLNVATWNLTTRKLTGDAPGGFLVDGEPLGFYHFTGFDSGSHRMMMHKNATGNATVRDLVDWYAGLTEKLSGDPLSRVPWRFGSFADGTQISTEARLLYRVRLDLQKRFPDPYNCVDGGYVGWLHTKARNEYPRLFDGSSKAAEILRLSTPVSLGYCGGRIDGKFNVRMFTAQLQQSLTNTAHRNRLAKRAWEILRTEGYKGLLQRFVKS